MTKTTRRNIDAASKVKIALEAMREREVERLHAKIGRLAVEGDFCSAEVWSMSATDRRARFDRDAKVLSIRRRCAFLGEDALGRLSDAQARQR